MHALVQAVRADGRTITARTVNDLVLVLQVTDGTSLTVGEELELELPEILNSKRVRRMSDGATVAVALHRYDIHDLRNLGGHSAPSNVSDERMRAE